MTAAVLSVEERFEQVLADHIARYPAMQVADVYKLGHQACLGSEHAVSDMEGARRMLELEVKTLSPGPPEPLPDPISPATGICRIHLRPFLSHDGDVSLLLKAFVHTANEYDGCPAHLDIFGATAEKICNSGRLPFRPGDVQVYWEQMKADGYPATHHSPEYRTAYRPAYRLVAGEFLPDGCVQRISTQCI